MRQKICLKDIVSLSKGKQINAKELIENGKYDYLNGGINPSGKFDSFNVEGNTITISEGGNSCGYVNYMEQPFWCGAHCYYLFDIKSNKKYLFYALKSQQDRIMKLRSGACMPNIKKNDIENFKIFFDNDLHIQIKIAKVLEKISDIISLRKQQLAALDTFIKARFVEMFGNWQSTAFEVKKLEELCEFIKDGTHNTPTYTNDFITGYRFLSSKDVITGYINWSNNKYIPTELHEKLHSRIAPKRNDILLAKNGTTGICAIVDTDEIFDIYVSLALLRFLPGINITYMWSAINMPETKAQFDERLKGVGVPNLHLGEIKQIKVIVPPIDLQNRFASFVAHIDKSKVVVQKALDEAQTLFDSVMQEYFG